MFPYPGGKSKISKWIIPHIPQCSTYVEPFGGAFWTYMKWGGNPRVVVYNDLNPQLANLFSCFCADRKKFANMLSRLPSEDRDTFLTIRQMFFSDFGGMDATIHRPNFDMAVLFTYLLTHHFIGHQITPSLRYQHIDTSRWSSRYGALIKKLKSQSYGSRLDSITNIENLDFANVIKKYDSPTTFFYVDPPYWNTEHYYTEGEFGGQQHKELANILTNIQGKFALSYYEFDELHRWYPSTTFNWDKRQFTSPMSAGAKSAKVQQGHGKKVDVTNHKSTELLIMNYQK